MKWKYIVISEVGKIAIKEFIYIYIYIYVYIYVSVCVCYTFHRAYSLILNKSTEKRQFDLR